MCRLSPGFPGSDDQHQGLDGHLDWIADTLDLLEAADLAGALLRSAPLLLVALAAGMILPAALRRGNGLAPGQKVLIVLDQFEQWLHRLVREGDPLFTHTLEGADDMPSHIKSALTATSLTIPVIGGRLALGTWQGIYLWEHRHRGHRRTVVITVTGE